MLKFSFLHLEYNLFSKEVVKCKILIIFGVAASITNIVGHVNHHAMYAAKDIDPFTEIVADNLNISISESFQQLEYILQKDLQLS